MHRHGHGDVVVLRYITSDGRIEIVWPCRVVQDTESVVALFIAAGTTYKADPKRTAAQKRADARSPVPSHENVWRNDALRLMFPGASHSVLLFWDGRGPERRFLRYFVNLEDPFRRTPAGFDTRDHTLDIVVTPELECAWRDEDEFESHVELGLYTPELAAAARAEGERVIEAVALRTHPCLQGWSRWSPDPQWTLPTIPQNWDTPAVNHTAD
jgi:predicted RNA-binding protein associated with RNAse of E/G family